MSDAAVNSFLAPATAAAQQQRLRGALAGLQNALAQQKRALTEFRFAMAELSVGTAGLGMALSSFQDTLGTVESRRGACAA